MTRRHTWAKIEFAVLAGSIPPSKSARPGIIRKTRTVATVIQAVSPEFTQSIEVAAVKS